MVRLELRPRISQALRCSYCHQSLRGDEEVMSCRRCDTRMHAACWLESGPCPTYGCTGPRSRPKVRIRLGEGPRPEPQRFSEDTLLCAGLTAAGWGFAALVVPPFQKMFEEVGICMLSSTAFVVGIPRWTWLVLGLLVSLVVVLKDRWLDRTRRIWCNLAYFTAILGLGVFVAMSLVAPLFSLNDRL